MLYQPETHEPLTDEPWNAERIREAIRAIAADTEAAFDDGWSVHPLDDEGSARYRTVYLGGAGVIDALRRLAERGAIEPTRDYVPYLERSLAAAARFPGGRFPPQSPDGRGRDTPRPATSVTVG